MVIRPEKIKTGQVTQQEVIEDSIKFKPKQIRDINRAERRRLGIKGKFMKRRAF